MITKKMEKSLNEQMNKEIFSAYLYLGMSAYSTSKGLKGFANWFYVQAKEEMIHAEKFFNYINEQGGRITLDAIDKPDQDFSSPVELFEKTLAHEKIVTKRINKLVDLAKKESDHATNAFLQWFVTEQVEEEASPSEILQKLEITGREKSGILLIDTELASRVFVPPQPAVN
jgi:ferritin